jgi:hypothetical protein
MKVLIMELMKEQRLAWKRCGKPRGMKSGARISEREKSEQEEKKLQGCLPKTHSCNRQKK